MKKGLQTGKNDQSIEKFIENIKRVLLKFLHNSRETAVFWKANMKSDL